MKKISVLLLSISILFCAAMNQNQFRFSEDFLYALNDSVSENTKQKLESLADKIIIKRGFDIDFMEKNFFQDSLYYYVYYKTNRIGYVGGCATLVFDKIEFKLVNKQFGQ